MRNIIYAARCAVVGLLALAAAACGGKQENAGGFSNYIKACTGGIITDNSSVRVEFTSPVSADCEASRLLSFSPSLKGDARWVSGSVLEFIPDEGALKAGKDYTAKLRLDRLFPIEDKAMKSFEFSFCVAPKQLAVSIDRLLVDPADPELVNVGGELRFSSPVDEETAKSSLSWNIKGEGSLEVQGGNGGKTYSYTVSGLKRGPEARELTVKADASSKGFKKKAEAKTCIPARDGFSLILKNSVRGSEPYIDLMFSQLLDKGQNPDGLFTIVEASRWFYQKDGSRMRIYFENTDEKSLHVNLSAHICSADGEELGEDLELVFELGEKVPSVELRQEGNILPDPSDLSLYFNATQLRAVDLSIVKIYENNILSFLQDNDISGNDQLRRNGRLVYRSTIALDGDPSLNLHETHLFKLDLSGILRKEPGAIYVARLGFRKDYSLYGSADEFGSGVTDGMVTLRAESGVSEEDEDIWNQPYSYYYEDFYDWSRYNWDESYNPLKDSFYMNGWRFPQVTLFSSNIGITVKSQNGQKLWVAVNDILSGEPVKGAEVDVYSFQKQRVGSGKTDRNGFVTIDTDRKAWAVVARSGRATGYLKVVDGQENNLSRFDVGGKTVSRGLKGYIYGERGVWSPGDTLHLTFIAEDREKRLPEDHPVTMEVYTPQGQFYEKQIDTDGKDGFHHFELGTSADDPTGIWHAYFKIGGASFHKSLLIEEVKANRLKVKLESGSKQLQSHRPATFNIHSEWLTGPTAKGLNTTVTMTLKKAYGAFPQYEGYIFDDPAADYEGWSSEILSGTLDGNGNFSSRATMPGVPGAPGMMKAELVTKVFEQGGNMSVATSSLPFSPYPAYVGILPPESRDGTLETDRDNVFKVVVVDPDGRKVDGHNIEYAIYKMEWNWWFQDSSSSIASYVNGTAANAVERGTVVARGGNAEFTLRTDYPDWGRYLVYVKDMTGSHASGCTVMVDWPEWRGRANRENPQGATLLSLSTDRDKCKVGDEVTLFIPGADKSHALVTVENSCGVLREEWVRTSPEGGKYKIKVTKEMAPNFYIGVTLLQPYRQTSNDAPLRLYGVKSVSVENADSRLHPVISAPSVIRPQESFKLKISEENGRPMTYTIAIVDEGLLDLTSFKTPDPWSEMYSKEALGIKTWDLYDNVAGAFSAALASALSVGGDESINADKVRERRFNPVVRYLGPFTLTKGSRSHSIKLPMYVGSVRIMVVAGRDGAFGNASRSVPVLNPLMILSSLPASVGCTESITLPVNVFAMEDGIKDVNVTVKAEGPVKVSPAGGESLSFSEAGDKVARFRLTAGKEEGEAKITIVAEGGGKKVSETLVLKVVNPNPPVISGERRMLAPGESTVFDWDPAGTTDVSVQLSGFPSCDFNKIYDQSKAWGYSGTVQMAARGMAACYSLDQLRKERRDDAGRMIENTLKQIYTRQISNGGFGSWKGGTRADEWTSSLAGEFLLKASACGFKVDAGVLASWRNFQKKCSVNYRKGSGVETSDLVQAYRLYTLALAGAADESAMNRLKADTGLSAAATWQLAGAYCLSGKKNIAREMTASTEAASGESNRAVMLNTLVLCERLTEARELAGEVAESMNDAWSAETIAFGTRAMSRLAAKIGREAIEAEVDGRNTRSANAITGYTPEISAGRTAIRNSSDATIWAELSLTSKPEAGSRQEAGASGLSIERSFVNASRQPVNPCSMQQSTDFYELISVRNLSGRTLKGLELTQNCPTGWEVFNDRLYGAGAIDEDAYNFKDMRNDGANWNFDLDAGEERTFVLHLNAVYEGEFMLPAAVCRYTEDGGIYANTESATIRTTR